MAYLNLMDNRSKQFLLSSVGDPEFRRQLAEAIPSYVDVNITAAQMDTLNATPVELVPAPGAGKMIQVLNVYGYLDFVTTAFELGTGTLDIRYENSSGGLCAQFTNAWVESSADAYFNADGRDVIGLANKAIVAHASADVTAGAGNITLRVYYRVVDATLSV